jgi:uracil-DNA glycosylase
MADISLALSKVHSDWLSFLPDTFLAVSKVIESLPDECAPNIEDLLNVFQMPPSEVRVVIVGQDPYPNLGDAIGYAFATLNTNKTPKSLQNIFKEIANEFGEVNTDNTLRSWIEQGVFLLNRNLSTAPGKSLAHANIGWQSITEDVVKLLGKNESVVALLMGKEAATLQSNFAKSVVTSHPSPLSAYRGFFGSGVFKQVNLMLEKPIKW